MTTTESPKDTRSSEFLMQRHFLRNYMAHVLEGGLYIGGLAFLSTDTVMPAMIRTLGGPNWLIALTPMMIVLGFSWPPLLTAHRVEQLLYVKPFVLTVGVFQRLPYLIAGLALLFLAERSPLLVLTLVALAPFASGTVIGISYAAWLELVSKTIPPSRRSSVWAFRFIISSAIGVAAGGMIKATLDAYPGARGYGILHMVLFGFLVLSFVAFALIRETGPQPVKEDQSRSLWQNLRSLPSIVRDDKRYFDFLRMRVLSLGLFIMTPFLAIHALTVLNKSDSYLGFLVSTQMVGTICGNILAGFVGDRYGGKVPVVISRTVFVVVCAAATVSSTAWAFMGVYFLYGFGFAFDRVGSATLSIELCPDARRPTYLSLLAALMFPGMLVASGLSTLVRELTGQLAPAAGLAAVASAGSLFYALRIKEPRHGN